MLKQTGLYNNSYILVGFTQIVNK